jgi:hypothetical protein
MRFGLHRGRDESSRVRGSGLCVINGFRWVRLSESGALSRAKRGYVGSFAVSKKQRVENLFQRRSCCVREVIGTKPIERRIAYCMSLPVNTSARSWPI